MSIFVTLTGWAKNLLMKKFYLARVARELNPLLKTNFICRLAHRAALATQLPP